VKKFLLFVELEDTVPPSYVLAIDNDPASTPSPTTTIFPLGTVLILPFNLSLALPNGYSLEDFRQNISDVVFISSCVLHHSFVLSRKHKYKDEGTVFLVV
jgi:hypothetical protein